MVGGLWGEVGVKRHGREPCPSVNESSLSPALLVSPPLMVVRADTLTREEQRRVEDFQLAAARE